MTELAKPEFFPAMNALPITRGRSQALFPDCEVVVVAAACVAMPEAPDPRQACLNWSRA